MELKIGEAYTTFEISEFMAHTVKREIVIKGERDGRYIFALKGKRKQYYFNVDTGLAVFEGNDLPFIADSDTNSFSGNAMINLIGDIEVIREYFENKQLNPEFNEQDRIIALDKERKEIRVFV